MKTAFAAGALCALVLLTETGNAFYCANSMTTAFATYCSGLGGTISTLDNAEFSNGGHCSYVCFSNAAEKTSVESKKNNATAATGSCGSNASPVYSSGAVMTTSPATCNISENVCGGPNSPTYYSINSAVKPISSCKCNAGYWGATSVPTTCTRCPKICDNPSGSEVFGTSTAGSTAQTQCQAPAGTQCKDGAGDYTFQAACSYQ